MFQLDELLGRLDISAEFTGGREFDSLGLIGAKSNDRICSFIKDPRFIDSISDSVKLIITSIEIANNIKGKDLCIVDEPWTTFFRVHNMLTEDSRYCREIKKNVIGTNCRISGDARLDESNIIIGNNVVIEDFVTIRKNSIIGDNSIIRAGTRIGEEGFEFKKVGNEFFYVKHVGGVIVGKNVIVMHNTSIDKAIYPWDNTIVSDECIISSQVQISHAVVLRERVTAASNVFIGGRTVVEEDVWIGPGAILSNGLKVGKEARINIGSVVTKDVHDGTSISGNFAIDHDKFLAHLKSIR